MKKNIINTTISIMRMSGVLIAIGESGKLVLLISLIFSAVYVTVEPKILFQKYLQKIEKILTSAIKSGSVKKDINPRISAIAFLGVAPG